MGAETAVKQYKPPSCPPAEELNFRLEFTETDEFRVRQVLYRDFIVDFAIMQMVREDGSWVHVARIDCCHSTIHRHQFTHAGDDLYDHLEITAIPPDGGDRWSIVHAGYFSALGTMQEEWAENLRRWRDGR
ncbi:DUF7718 family protein [Actinacidiphila oryziradicis]|uniref:Uncharacterized protein n=1 Tax=Actinacidiphila oryziradicis TaxID=2571141 RepID=A0A4V5N1B3_9ACTN|nr:hypothetical protein [Actinacidiphila oryziradicis]TKA09509.1 hypothetical protein FCI23_21940 [Actinacidiphila oryziradicis]